MLAVSLNPGFVLALAAFAVLAAPQSMRPATIAAAAAGAMYLLLDRDFGAASAVAQMGLTVVLLNLDALSQVFGIAFIAALLLLALYSAPRRSRFEDAAILLLAGGAVSALFVGDLVSFVAAASVAGLAAVWVVLASPLPGANGAGVRLLIWHGLEGLLFLAGVAFHLSSGSAKNEFERLDTASLGGGFIFAALMIRVGAPLAHVWLRDSISHASGAGAVALSVFSSMFGVYALARMFPSEPLLVPIGMAMIVIGALYAAAEDDLRRAAAYALTAQTGVCVTLIGIGSPVALAGAAAHAFTSIFAFALIQMALGAVVMKRGNVRASEIEGLSQAMPMSAVFLALGGLAISATPGFSLYISHAVALDAAAHWDLRLIWSLFAALPALMIASLAIRPALLAFRPALKRPPFAEAPFLMQLAAALATFLSAAVGFNPTWLYRLLPTNGLAFAPFTLDRLAPQLELLGAAGAAYVAIRAVRLVPKERALRLLDVDALYRGPIAGAGRWSGAVMLRIYGAAQTVVSRLADRGRAGFTALAQRCDRPYADSWAGAAQLGVICAVLVIILIARR